MHGMEAGPRGLVPEVPCTASSALGDCGNAFNREEVTVTSGLELALGLYHVVAS